MTGLTHIIFKPGTTSIPQYIFRGITAPLNAHIPQSVTYAGMDDAFKDSNGNTIINVTIVGYENSPAIAYAEDKGIPYKVFLLAVDRVYEQPVEFVPYQYIFQLLDTAPDRDKINFRTLPANALDGSGLTLLPNGEIYGAPLFEKEFTFTLLAYVGNSIPDEMEVTLEIQPRTDENVEKANNYAILIPVGEDDRLVSGYYEDMEDLIFKVSGEYTDFAGFWIDGFKLTRPAQYRADPGSTVITAYAETFKELGNGAHTIAAEFMISDGQGGPAVQRVAAQNFTLDLTEGPKQEEPETPPDGGEKPTEQDPGGAGPSDGSDDNSGSDDGSGNEDEGEDSGGEDKGGDTDGNNEGAGDGKNENPGTPGDNQDGNPPDGPSTPNGETNTPSTPDGDTDPNAPGTSDNPNTPGNNTDTPDGAENGDTPAPETPGDAPGPGEAAPVPPGNADAGDNAGNANTPGGNTVGAASGGTNTGADGPGSAGTNTGAQPATNETGAAVPTPPPSVVSLIGETGTEASDAGTGAAVAGTAGEPNAGNAGAGALAASGGGTPGGLARTADGSLTYTLGADGAPFELRIDIPFAEFRGLAFDGAPWERGTDYAVREGSTILTITAERLSVFDAGVHRVSAVFENETVEIEFLLQKPAGNAAGGEAAADPSAAEPGLPAPAIAAIALVLLVLLAAGIVVILRYRRSSRTA
jgi:hypothetical protein